MIYHHHIPECSEESVIGYCEGCEKPDAELVECHEGFFEYCEPCLEEKAEGDAHAAYDDRLIKRADNGWRDA
jgi:hypothetical protein